MIGKKLFALTLKDKKINPPKGNNLVSPACGKILKILKVSDNTDLKIEKGILGIVRSTAKGIIENGYIISIFLRVYDNHINRAPLDGHVISVKHSLGKFKPASSLRAFENEKAEIVLDSAIGKVKIIQIAGLIARRIETFIAPGDVVEKGKSIGLIKLGSQVSMIIPDRVKLKVREGQKVEAGETIIGEL